MYKGNNVFIQKLLIFINMIILPVIIVLAWHFATSTGAMSTPHRSWKNVSSELLAAVYTNLSAICTSVHFRRIKTGAECILDGSGRCRDDRSHIRYRFSYQRCTKPVAVSGCICRNHCHRSRWCDHGSGHFTDWKIMHTLGKRQVSTNGKDIINSERK